MSFIDAFCCPSKEVDEDKPKLKKVPAKMVSYAGWDTPLSQDAEKLGVQRLSSMVEAEMVRGFTGFAGCMTASNAAVGMMEKIKEALHKPHPGECKVIITCSSNASLERDLSRFRVQATRTSEEVQLTENNPLYESLVRILDTTTKQRAVEQWQAQFGVHMEVALYLQRYCEQSESQHRYPKSISMRGHRLLRSVLDACREQGLEESGFRLSEIDTLAESPEFLEIVKFAPLASLLAPAMGILAKKGIEEALFPDFMKKLVENLAGIVSSVTLSNGIAGMFGKMTGLSFASTESLAGSDRERMVLVRILFFWLCAMAIKLGENITLPPAVLSFILWHVAYWASAAKETTAERHKQRVAALVNTSVAAKEKGELIGAAAAVDDLFGGMFDIRAEDEMPEVIPAATVATVSPVLDFIRRICAAACGLANRPHNLDALASRADYLYNMVDSLASSDIMGLFLKSEVPKTFMPENVQTINVRVIGSTWLDTLLQDPDTHAKVFELTTDLLWHAKRKTVPAVATLSRKRKAME